MKRFIILIAGLLAYQIIMAQTEPEHDSVRVLENVVVTAFESHSRIISTPAAVSRVGSVDLNRSDNSTILQAINTKPGVRMDERSPGSYRLNIRGSSMRSPFGVSNVKVYYDGIPLTGPGGSTDLNMLGFYNVQSVEIVRGPAGSMYGAGTGGALFINSEPDVFEPGLSAGYTYGSYNLNNINLSLKFGNTGANSSVNFQHINSDGYRDHTKMRRDVISWNSSLKKTEKSLLNAHFYYSDLYYQTPGALTKAEFDANPRAARPNAGAFPSASEAKAAIYDQAFLAGFSLQQKISKAWQNNTALYGYYFRHNNPTFRNYTRRVEPNFGARTNFRYQKSLSGTMLTVNFGGEFQKSFITSRLYNNVNGATGAMQTDDEVNYTQGFVFGQAKIETQNGWIFVAGASINKSKVEFNRFNVSPAQIENRDFKGEVAPRIAAMKKMNKSLSLYLSAERGFSSPASAELLPTSGVFNTRLHAESGVNYELGLKGNFVNNRLFIDASVFRYRLKNAIVQRQDAGGGIFYDNAGSTNQTGIESYISYAFLDRPARFFEYGFAYLSQTWNHFRYDDYKQLSNDYSGNKITGVAPQTIAAGADIRTQPGLFANLTYFYSDRIPLNDANTAYANAYHLIGLKLGHSLHLSEKARLELFVGVQNLLDETYSLGNDINAAGGRYYNVAAGRNYYGGFKIRL